MSYIVETRSDIPHVIVNVLNADFSAGKELPLVLDDLKAKFSEMNEPFYYISDTGQAKWGFGEMVQAMAASAGRGINFLKNPLLKEIIVITDSNLIQMGVSALAQEQYGFLHARTMPHLDDAMAYVREKIGEKL